MVLSDEELDGIESACKRFPTIRQLVSEVRKLRKRHRERKLAGQVNADWSQVGVDIFSWSTRVQKTFKRLDIETVGDLLNVTAGQLMQAENFGETSLNEVEWKLSQLGLKLKEV